MKKVLILIVATLVVGSALVTARTVFADNRADTTPNQVTTPAGGTGQPERTLSEDEKLLVGMIQLNRTAQSVTQAQATILLPLWQQYLALVQKAMPDRNTSDQQTQATPVTPAATPNANTELETQLAALITQVKAILTTEQINAISALSITQESSMQLLQTYGLQTEMGKDGNGPNQNDQQSQTPQSQALAGDPPQGNGPQGNGQTGNGQPPALPDTSGKMNGINPGMVESLITYLQQVSTAEVMLTATPVS